MGTYFTPLALGGISTLDSAQSRRELSAQFCEEDTDTMKEQS